MKKPLYRFDLDTVTGEINKIKITNYEEGDTPNHSEYYYRYLENSQFRYCYIRDLDRFKSNRMYSFDEDFQHAFDIIFGQLCERCTKAYKDYVNYSMIQTMVIEANKDDKGRSRQNNDRDKG